MVEDPLHYWSSGPEPWSEDEEDAFTEEEYMSIGRGIIVKDENQKEYMSGRVLDWAYNARVSASMLDMLLEGTLCVVGIDDDDNLMFALRSSLEGRFISEDGGID